MIMSSPPKIHSVLGSFSKWEQWQIERVNSLSDRAVSQELKGIMRNINYSWRLISRKLEERVDSGLLEIEHFEPGNIIYEWNVLCDEKICWQRNGRPSFRSFRFNRDCLTKLKIIPTQAGLGTEGRKARSLSSPSINRSFRYKARGHESGWHCSAKFGRPCRWRIF